MKKAILLFATIFGIVQSYAQPPGATERAAHRALIAPFLAAGQTSRAAKPTGIQQRVIAAAYSDMDSAAYKYSGSRGSRYNYDGNGYAFSFDTYSFRPLLPGGANPMDVQADSFFYFNPDGDLSQMGAARYRPDNKAYYGYAAIVYPPSTIIHNAQNNIYNSAGYLVATYYGDSTATGLDSSQRRIITYNSTMTRIETDSIITTGSGSSGITHYYYSTSDRADSAWLYDFDSGSPWHSETIILDYYSDGKLRKYIRNQYNDTGTLIIRETDSFGYTPGISYTTLWDTHTQYFDPVGEFATRWIKYPGANGFPDSTADFSWNNGNWEAGTRSYYTYTDFDVPSDIMTVDDDIITSKVHFYYEEYDAGETGIAPLTQNKDFSLYPNPFRNDLYIDWKGKQSKVAVSLYNMIGQEVYRSTLSLRNGKNTLSIPGINAGNYMLLLQDVDGKTWSSKVVKQ